MARFAYALAASLAITASTTIATSPGGHLPGGRVSRGRVAVPPSVQYAPAAAALRAQPTAAPTLIVFITVDQLRPDYFTRFEKQLTGGLGRLWRQGAVFTNASHDHAITETAPGHASTMSGRFPRSTGITANVFGVPDPGAPLIDATGPGASPFRFRGTVLADWMRAKDPRTRILSVSRKDRSAILPVGRLRTNVYWFAPSGSFTTSTYYADTLPAWVKRFNARGLPASYAGKVWDTLLDAAAYPEPDSVAAENGGRNAVFPYAVPVDPARAARALPSFPMMDEVTLAFALEGLAALDLGRGPQTDLLAVSLSATDAVGHAFGPDSRELHDQILRVDRYLGVFFDSLYKLRDSTRIVVALTSDHGVAPFPGVKSYDRNAGASYATLGAVYGPTMRKLLAMGLDTSAFRYDEFLRVDRAAFARAGVNADSVIAAFADEVRRVPGVLSAEPLATLARRDTTRDVLARRWIRAIPPDVTADLVVTLKPYWFWGRPGVDAQHGSPHDYDARVPVIFYGPPVKPGKYGEPARVVDMAPTLAAILNVPPAERLDGRVLRAALR